MPRRKNSSQVIKLASAYDSIIQEDLWEILGTMDVEDAVTNLLKDIYKSNKVLIKWEKMCQSL